MFIVRLIECSIGRAWPETAPDIDWPRLNMGFKTLFASANNTHANTCVYLSVFDEIRLLPRRTKNHYPMP